VKRTLDCKHAHDEACGYAPADPGHPCGYECKFCPIEALIGALLPHITGDNQDAVTEQLQEILSLFAALDEVEQEQIDISPCIRLQEELDGANRIQTLADGTVAENDTTWENGTYTVSGNITLTNRIEVKGTVTLQLNADCKLTASAGIAVTEGNSLTIEGSGTLEATGSSGRTGIGGNYQGDNSKTDATGGGATGGTITINGGTVIATGSNYAAGIGGGNNDNGASAACGGIIIINGGTVTATGGKFLSASGAGIGGGYNGDGGNITIKGGTVTATGESGSAGIGGGSGGTFSTTENGKAWIEASSISDNSDTSGWNGIIFQNGAGQVYGDTDTIQDNYFYKLEGDAIIPAGATLTVPDGATLLVWDSLTVPKGAAIINYGALTTYKSLTVNGTVTNNAALHINSGTLTGTGTLNGEGPQFTTSVITPDMIVVDPIPAYNGSDRSENIKENVKLRIMGRDFQTEVWTLSVAPKDGSVTEYIESIRK